MTEIPRPPQRNLPMYLPTGFLSFDDWARFRTSREDRIGMLVQPKFDREIIRINSPGVASFLQTATEELSAISQTRFTNQGNPPSEIPIFCILDKDSQGKKYNLNGNRGAHDNITLVAAQLLVEALCPEQDVDINKDWQDLLGNAAKAEELGYAEVWSSYENSKPDHVRYQTILPGVSIVFSNHTADRYIGLSWDIM